MSIRIMSAVWELELSDSEKIVLLALADNANDQGVCWPSMATIARKCSKGERTVQGAIKSLEAAGHLSRAEKLGKGVTYTIHPRSGCAPQKLRPRSEQHPPPAVAADKPSMNRHSLEANASKGRTRKSAGFTAPEGVSDTIWQTFASQRKKRLTQIAYDRILKTLGEAQRAGWPPGEMIERAIERGWETVFVPKEERNGQRYNGQSASGYGRTVDAALDFVRDLEGGNAH